MTSEKSVAGTGLTPAEYDRLGWRVGTKTLKGIRRVHGDTVLKPLLNQTAEMNADQIHDFVSHYSEINQGCLPALAPYLMTAHGWSAADVVRVDVEALRLCPPTSPGPLVVFQSYLHWFLDLASLTHGGSIRPNELLLSFSMELTAMSGIDFPMRPPHGWTAPVIEPTGWGSQGAASGNSAYYHFWRQWRTKLKSLPATPIPTGPTATVTVHRAILERVDVNAWLAELAESNESDPNQVTLRLSCLRENGTVLEQYARVLESRTIPRTVAAEASKEVFDVASFDSIIEAGLPHAEAYEISRTSLVAQDWIIVRRQIDAISAAQIAQRVPALLVEYVNTRAAGATHDDCLRVVDAGLSLSLYGATRRVGLNHVDSIKSLLGERALEAQTSAIVGAIEGGAMAQADALGRLSVRLQASIEESASFTAGAMEDAARSIVRASARGWLYSW